MTNINDRIADDLIKHQTDIERYKNSELNAVLVILLEKERDVKKLIVDNYGSSSRVKQQQLLRKIQKAITASYAKIKERLVKQEAFAKQEKETNVEILNGSLTDDLGSAIKFINSDEGIVLDDDNKNKINTFPDGRSVNSWVLSLVASDYARTESILRTGIAEDSDVNEVLREVTGTRSSKYRDGSNAISRNQAASVLFTVIQASSEQAKNFVAMANASLIAGLRYTVVLDNATTALCQSRSGRIYSVAKHPVIPAHVNCRSHYAYVFKSLKGISKSNIRNQSSLDNLSSSAKNEFITTGSDIGTFGAWLKRQPVSVQDDILGVKRGQLFRKGGFDNPLRSFFSEAKKKPLTLNELRARYAEHWNKAGLK